MPGKLRSRETRSVEAKESSSQARLQSKKALKGIQSEDYAIEQPKSKSTIRGTFPIRVSYVRWRNGLQEAREHCLCPTTKEMMKYVLCHMHCTVKLTMTFQAQDK